MKVRICPLCDSEMKKAHYCDVCNSWILKPQIIDIHYNAEARAKGEEDCAYGTVHDDRDHHQEENLQKLKHVLKTPSYKVIKEDAEKSNNKHKGWIAKIIAIIVGLNVIGSVVSGAFSLFDNDDFDLDMVESHIENFFVKEPESKGEFVDDGRGYEVIADEDVASYADSCSRNHFEATGDSMFPVLKDWVAQNYNNTNEPYYYNDNYKYMSEDQEYVYLEKQYMFDLSTDTSYAYVQVDSDSATDKIHTVSFMFPDKQSLEQCLRLVLPLIQTEFSDEAYMQKVFDELNQSAMFSDNELYISYMEYEDGSIWAEISPVS